MVLWRQRNDTETWNESTDDIERVSRQNVAFIVDEKGETNCTKSLSCYFHTFYSCRRFFFVSLQQMSESKKKMQNRWATFLRLDECSKIESNSQSCLPFFCIAVSSIDPTKDFTVDGINGFTKKKKKKRRHRFVEFSSRENLKISQLLISRLFSQPNNFHELSTWRAREGIQRGSLSRCLRERNALIKNRSTRR